MPVASASATFEDGATGDLIETTLPMPESPPPYIAPILSTPYIAPVPSTPSLVPKPSTLPLAQKPSILSLTSKPFPPSDRSYATPSHSGAAQFAPDHLGLVRDWSDATPAPSVHMSDQPGVTPSQLDTGNSHPSDVPRQLDLPRPVITVTMSPLPETTPSPPIPVPGSVLPRPAGEPRQVAPDYARSQAGARLMGSPSSYERTSHTSATPPPNPLVGRTNEPMWMKKKGTLSYFHRTFKLGDLSNVIGHWYKLEGLLGFQDIVSVLE